MIFDMHVNVGPSFNGKGHTVENYIEEMENNGFDKAVLCPNRPSSYSFEEANEYVKEAVAKYPEKFVGALRVDPWNWDAATTSDYFALSSFKLLYLNPWEDNFRSNDSIAFPIYEYAGENNIPIIIETGYPFVSHISQIGEMAEKYPETTFITTNAGQIDLSGFTLADVGYMLDMHKNLYVGTAAAVGAEWLANQIQNVSKGRVLFESGYPFFDPATEKYRIEVAYIEDSDKDDVYSNNLITLLRI